MVMLRLVSLVRKLDSSVRVAVAQSTCNLLWPWLLNLMRSAKLVGLRQHLMVVGQMLISRLTKARLAQG